MRTHRGESTKAFLSAGLIFFGYLTVLVYAQAPTGETTAFNGWGAAGNTETVGRWQQTLTKKQAADNYKDKSVTEANGNAGGAGSGNDSCWFAGGAFGKFDAITGGTWTVDANQMWGDDFVGWTRQGVVYYRNKGKAPCGTTFLQNMIFDPAGANVQYVTGNVLGGDIGKKTVSSSRAGKTESKNY